MCVNIECIYRRKNLSVYIRMYCTCGMAIYIYAIDKFIGATCNENRARLLYIYTVQIYFYTLLLLLYFYENKSCIYFYTFSI